MRFRSRAASWVAVMSMAVMLPGCGRHGRRGPCVSESPIDTACFERTLGDGATARGMIARIDLAHPRLRIEVTGAPQGAGPGVEALLETTPAWALRRELDLAVNANYFAMTRPREPYAVGGRADVLGLCVSDGVLVSPPRTFQGRGDPALLLRHDGRGEIARVERTPGLDVRHAVAGIGGSASDPDRGSLLIEGGEDRSATARVDPLARHPRTAAGLAMGGRLLVLEFSRVWAPLAPAYSLYTLKVLPLLGRLVAGDSASYRYLGESIARHPDQDTLAAMMRTVGFERVEYFNLTAGVVALHRGYRL